MKLSNKVVVKPDTDEKVKAKAGGEEKRPDVQMGGKKGPASKTKRRASTQFPVAFAYFLTLLLCLGAFGGIGYYVVDRFVMRDTESVPVAVDTGIPTAEDRYTTLYVQVSEDGTMNNGLLVRVIPDKTMVRIVPVSKGLMASPTEGDVKSTVGEIYSTSGVIAVRNAVENAYQIDIDKYMTVSDSAFDSIVDYIGGVTYTPTEDMFYFNVDTGDELSCRKGEKIALNHHLLRLFINYPSFAEGYSANSKVMADIMEHFINDAFMQFEMLTNNLDTIFNIIYNSSDTDMTRNDFIRYKNAITYILDNETSPCTSLNPAGVWTNNTFEVGDGFVSELATFFDPNDDDTVSDDT